MSNQAAAKVRGNFAEILNQVAYGKERVVIERRGKELAAVIPIEDLKVLEELENRNDLEDAKKAIADAKKHGALPWDAVKKKSKKR